MTLKQALEEACRFARMHGVEQIAPEDFAIHCGHLTQARYVDADVAVVVVLDQHGTPTFGLADLDWSHFPDHVNGTEACTEGCDSRRPVVTVHLPDEVASGAPESVVSESLRMEA